MKKVRMIVSAVAIFAVVGSALAFKSHKTSGLFFCNVNANQAATCSDQVTKYIINTSTGSAAFCNNGAGGTDCNQSIAHVQQNAQ
jgi:hypothetical protein